MTLGDDANPAALSAGNAELQAFASKVSHDLKNPLAVISGAAETLRRAWDRLSEGDRNQLLDALANQANRAAAMLDELVLLTAADQENPSPEN